jgi:cytoplasmic iron level regulating protein YaaA (DUF328/UPF0246 family)
VSYEVFKFDVAEDLVTKDQELLRLLTKKRKHNLSRLKGFSAEKLEKNSNDFIIFQKLPMIVSSFLFIGKGKQ